MQGKSFVTEQSCKLQGYNPIFMFPLYAEISLSGLYIRIGEHSPLLDAAADGPVYVVDGIDKLSPDTVSGLESLLTDRDVWLPDGTHLSVANGTIHPNFQVIALANSMKKMDSAMFSTFELSHTRILDPSNSWYIWIEKWSSFWTQ